MAKVHNRTESSDAPRPARACVVLMPRTKTSLSRMLLQYQLLDKTPDLRPHFLIASPELWDFEGLAAKDGLRFSKVGPILRQDQEHFTRFLKRSAATPSLAGSLPAKFGRFGEWLEHGMPMSLLRMVIARRWLRNDYHLLRQEIEALSPSIILMPGDRELGFVLPALKVARDLGVPTLISDLVQPYPMSQISTRLGQRRFLLEPRWSSPHLNRIAARKFPEQVYPGGEPAYLFTPGWLTLVLAGEGMLSKNPWVHGGGSSTAILCASSACRDALEQLDVETRKIRVIGDLLHDELHSKLALRSLVRTELFRQHSLNRELPLVIFAVPNYAEHHLMSWNEHLANVEAACASLKMVKANVLLSLHPKSEKLRYGEISSRYSMPIHNEPLVECIAAADVFIGGGSSTFDWAALCGVPTINLNYARLPTGYWAKFKCVVNITEARQTGSTLDSLLNNSEILSVAQRSKDTMSHTLGIFDGRSGQRFIDVVRELSVAHRCSGGGAACTPCEDLDQQPPVAHAANCQKP